MNRVQDQVTRKQLEEIEDLSNREKQPLLRRLSDLLENQVIRRIITQPESSISFRKAIADQQIILVDAQGGNVGDWAARIIGSIVLTKLWSATAARNTLPENQRPLFHIHIDEVQEFVSEADHLRRMLSQCREFNVSLTVATQYLDDLDTTMERAMVNNTMTKAVFSPGASDDLPTYTRIMNGLSKEDLTRIGKYRPALQQPAEQELPPAVVVDTYPPWDFDQETLEERKQQVLSQYDSLRNTTPDTKVSTGDVPAAGKEEHDALLAAAKQHLETRLDAQVTLNRQDGNDRADGHIIIDDDTMNLEAEASSLSRPVKELRNYLRGIEQGREVFFVVEAGDAAKLQNIVEDPKNRRGDDYEDEHGSYSYYTDENGEPFTEFETVEDADYRVIEIGEDELTIHDNEVEPECPQLEDYDRSRLEEFCVHREEDGFCTALETQCVLTSSDD